MPAAGARERRRAGGDPPFAPLAPADGATLPVSADGIAVSFTCPVYRIAKVPMLCPGIIAGQFTTQIATAKLRKVKIAPDGRFVGSATAGSDTAIRVRGRLKGRKVVDGRVELSLGACSGSQGFSAQRIGR